MSGYRGRGRGRGGGHGNPSTRIQKGLFADGNWLCNCQPRLPASHFQVKAETPNKGRWFYTCQKQKSDPDCCKFFLWEDDAKPREALTVLSGSRNEPRRDPATTPSRSLRRTRSVSPPPPYKSPTYDRATTPRRKYSRPGAEDDDEFGGSMTASDETLLQREADGAAAHQESPRKVARRDSYTTPNRRRLPWLENNAPNGLPTPNTTHTAKNPFTADAPALFHNSHMRSSSSRRADDEEILNGYTLPALNSTPTPSRFRDANIGDIDDAGLATEIFDVLRGGNVNLNEDAKEGLESVLARHSLRTQGIIKSREISRLGIKAKDAKITELQHRVATLEAELEAEKALVEHLRWEAATGQQSGT